ncbi:GNAT family N-acetyltransferase [Streptomyces sp. NPDC004629]|uniref:GNAT family N-acetyltransferase n=1 Tax=Streptomyces sp. NPDC004629 TaxID=3364705 RepID=UPI00367F82FC
MAPTYEQHSAPVRTPDPLPVPPDPEPHGHGLRLRLWDAGSEADVVAWHRGRSDPDFRRWNTPLRIAADLDGARASLRAQMQSAADGSCVPFLVMDAATGATLGHVAVNAIDHALRLARVGYWVLPEARGQRVATRALAVAARWAFTELGMHRLELGHALGHDASCRIAQNCGFPYEGTLRDAMFAAERHDAFRDVHLHARLATDPEPDLDPPRTGTGAAAPRTPGASA